MKTNLKLLALLLALLTLMSALSLASCQADSPDSPDSPDDIPPVTSSEPAAEASDLELIANGKAAFTIVRDSELRSDSAVVSAASELRQYIIETAALTSGNEPGIGNDWKKPGEEYDHEALEILVGNTDYPESAEAMSSLGYGEYAVRVIGKKLVVAGYTDEAVSTACDKLRELIGSTVSGGQLVIPADTNITGVANEAINTLPIYQGGTFSSTYDCGGNGSGLLISSTTPEAYAGYVAELEKSGYDIYTTHTITENTFTTLTDANYTVSVSYYAYEKSTRIIIEPLVTPVGLREDNVYQKRTTPQITMLGLEVDSDTTIGLSMLIRLADGRFIVVDGGFTGRASQDARLLVSALKEQSKDYLSSGEQITIAAWIITHPHGDHCGMLEKAYGNFKGMKIEQFLVNFMAPRTLMSTLSSSYGKNYSSADPTKYQGVLKAAKALETDVRYVRVGQVFYMADVTMEVLYTIDSYAPKVCNAMNTTSLIIKFTFDDGTTFMMTGDATGGAFQIAAKMYGSYLKSDILQVAHHGCKTWDNDAGTISAYKLISPATLLWPSGHQAYASRKAKAYNNVLYPTSEGGSNNNFKEYFVSGREGESVTIPIPYNTGSAIVTRVS